MAFLITLILVGVVLVLAEILIIPGVGIAGVLGIASLGSSCFLAFKEFGNTVGAIITIVESLFILIILIYALRAKTWKRLALNTNIDSKANSDVTETVSVGDFGKTLTRLCPMGTARIGKVVCEVKAVEGIVDSGTDVEVVLIEDNKIYVKPSGTDYDFPA